MLARVPDALPLRVAHTTTAGTPPHRVPQKRAVLAFLWDPALRTMWWTDSCSWRGKSGSWWRSPRLLLDDSTTRRRVVCVACDQALAFVEVGSGTFIGCPAMSRPIVAFLHRNVANVAVATIAIPCWCGILAYGEFGTVLSHVR